MKEKKSFMNLDVTLEEASGRLEKMDPSVVAAQAGVSYNKAKNALELEFINRRYAVLTPGCRVVDSEGNPTPTYFAILIMHYLVTAKGTPLSGEWISYRHLPGGDIYMDPFQKRAVQPFLKTFGNNPDAFVKAALQMGASRSEGRGVGMIFKVLPRVPILFKLWPGDDELPASANILFDTEAAGYMPTEDYAHLPAIVVGEMKKTVL